jgi:mannose-1-phosphate guanylyltransferase
VLDDITIFENAIHQAKALAETGSLLTFGIKPTRPETGYGYILSGDDFSVSEFIEKPNVIKAQEYVNAGDYLWNSGMFLFGAKAYLQELEQYREDVFQSVNKSYQGRAEDMDFIRVGVDEFEQCSSVSIDYAVMEKTKKAKVIPYDGGWSDIGAWNALYDYSDKDESQNVLLGDVMVEGSEHCLIRAEQSVVVSGTAKVNNGGNEILLTENQSTFIPVGSIHSLENPGKIPLELVEVQSGSYLDEDDIVRFSDRYGRSD